MFNVGDEVVCVEDRDIDRDLPLAWDGVIRRGQHYIVRWSGPHQITVNGRHITTERPCVRLAGIERTEGGKFLDTPFLSSRFRPVKRETIEVFRAMCVSKSPIVPLE